MRPPICDVCGADASDGGGLVRGVSTADDLSWRERSEREGWVGHPPDTGWFCVDHVGAARELAATTHLPGVLQALREPDAGADAARQSGAMSMGGLYQALRASMKELVAQWGLDPALITESTDRQWHPMDGSLPPDCPFADSTIHEAQAEGVRITLRLDSSWWNDADQARSSLAFHARAAGQTGFTVSAWSAASGAPDTVEGVKAEGAVPDDVAALLEPWAAPTES